MQRIEEDITGSEKTGLRDDTIIRLSRNPTNLNGSY